MNPFAHLPEKTFDLLNRWSHIKNLEVLILELDNMSENEKTSIKNTLTLILCNFDFYFTADLFLKNKCQLGHFDKKPTLIKCLKNILKSLENIKFRKLFDLPKFFIKTYKLIIIGFIENLTAQNQVEIDYKQLSDALNTLKDTFIIYEKFCANFTNHLKSKF